MEYVSMTGTRPKGPLNDVRIIHLSGNPEPPRQISLLELDEHAPFQVKRVYWIHSLSAGEVRGQHAHKNMQQLLVAASGSFIIKLDDGTNTIEYTLNTPTQALWVPAGVWRHIVTLENHSTLLSFASTHYDEDDYIRNYEEFRSFSAARATNTTMER